MSSGPPSFEAVVQEQEYTTAPCCFTPPSTERIFSREPARIPTSSLSDHSVCSSRIDNLLFVKITQTTIIAIDMTCTPAGLVYVP
jgi:hypothetical protein